MTTWNGSGMMFYCSIFSAIFFLIGLLLGRRWRPRQGGGYNNNRRPDFKRPAFPQGRPQQAAPAIPKDGPVELYVGNLALEVTKEEVEAEFGKHGKVLNIRLITKQGEDKSFGFVEMASPGDADEAIKALAGKDFMGNALEVNVAKSPRGHHRRRRR